MKLLFSTFGVMIFSLTLYVYCQPAITSLSPSIGNVGTSVIISGNNFSGTTSDNIVYFGATRATVNSASTNSLNVTVPSGTTFQYPTVTTGNLTAYSNEPFVITFPCDGIIGAGSFPTGGYYSSGTNPRSVTIADFDGDGKSDMAVGNHLSNTVSVYLNQSTVGSITFAVKIDYAVPSSPSEVTYGDIDGDGKLDIVSTNKNSNNISVLRNTCTIGNISFAAPVNFTTGSYCYGVAVNDLDSDGKPDIVASNFSSGNVSILRNLSTVGNISFASSTDLTTGTNPGGVALGDLDYDGKVDIIVGNRGSGTISIFRNTCTIGNISFAAKIDLTTATNPFNPAVGDIDDDGKVEIVVANEGSNSVSVFKNYSTSGNISFGPKTDFTTGAGPYRVALGDLNGDGKLDLATANNSGSNVSVLVNISAAGSISFLNKVDYNTGPNTSFISIGDLDGDEKPDMAATLEVSAQVVSLRNQVACTIGLNETNVSNLRIFPNPSNDKVSVYFNYNVENGYLRILDVLGREVKSIVFSGESATIEKDNLKPGTYFVYLHDANNILSIGKIIFE